MTEPGYQIGRQDGTTQREREVVNLLLAGNNQAQTARILSVSKERVRQIVSKLTSSGRLTKTDEGWNWNGGQEDS